VAGAGLTFIGPSADVIALMGDKVAARNFAAGHDVPLSPSAEEGEDFAARAAEIGFPLVIKAAAGGGGRGMRIVREAGDLDAAVATAKSEAERAFGSGVVYAERWIDRPRHIEVQVFGDGKGNAVHLWERECSIQRRFQKVIEEAPSPTISDAEREAICAAAVELAKAANYANAGTVEFVMAPDGAFYFLEMNTRLQVEHPVTEMVTGLDLVEWQVRIAAGEDIPLAQEDIALEGHAIEARIYAEDPDNGFMPATGRLLHVTWPGTWRCRVDTGFVEAQAVTAAFDPMIAKIIAHGDTRLDAVLSMEGALMETVILGVTTNTGWLGRLMQNQAFREAALDTGFLERHADDLAKQPLSEHGRSVVLAAAATTLEGRHGMAAPGPWGRIGPWRN
jgi:propionyl-CoA carboxylase alpha chain/3-methylcrotonyl-CoA carboxylase alpha subunit/acetyl-CoA/propionyl-CoA carboxylase biotin carboxyl carrier protein